MMSSTAWGTSHLIVLPRCTRSAAWHRAVESLGTVVMSDEWSIVLMLHCSHTIPACPQALQALTTLPARTSCRPMMILMPDVLEMCMHWEHVRLTTQACLLVYSLCLKLTTHRESWDT
jgi:hypothetical protein